MKVILAQPRGFCAGVVRAIEIVERALEKYGSPVYVRHEIVHNRHVVESLKLKGARFVEELDEVPPGAVTIFSAHGVSRAVERDAERARTFRARRDLPARVQGPSSRASATSTRGATVILIGHAGHPEVEGTMGQITGPVHLVQDQSDVAALDIPDDTPVAYITQTTLSVDDTRATIVALQEAVPRRRRSRDARHLLCDAESPDAPCASSPRSSISFWSSGQATARTPTACARSGPRSACRAISSADGSELDPSWFEANIDHRHHGRRLGSRGAGRGRDRGAARHRPRRGRDAGRNSGKRPVPPAVRSWSTLDAGREQGPSATEPDREPGVGIPLDQVISIGAYVVRQHLRGSEALSARPDARAAVSLQSRVRGLRQDRLSRQDPEPAPLGRGLPRTRSTNAARRSSSSPAASRCCTRSCPRSSRASSRQGQVRHLCTNALLLEKKIDQYKPHRLLHLVDPSRRRRGDARPLGLPEGRLRPRGGGHQDGQGARASASTSTARSSTMPRPSASRTSSTR